MATKKTKSSGWAWTHATWYTIPFGIAFAPSLKALFAIFSTHFIIDRFRLARYVVWAKNSLFGETVPWKECRDTGYPPDVPAWLSVWLLIIADNIMHLTINGLALKYL